MMLTTAITQPWLTMAMIMDITTRDHLMGKTMQNNREIKVWDPVVRGFHWATVLLCVLNLFILEEGARNHRYAGYALAGLLALRIVWGFIGSYHARFASGCRHRPASSPISRRRSRGATPTTPVTILWGP